MSSFFESQHGSAIASVRYYKQGEFNTKASHIKSGSFVVDVTLAPHVQEEVRARFVRNFMPMSRRRDAELKNGSRPPVKSAFMEFADGGPMLIRLETENAEKAGVLLQSFAEMIAADDYKEYKRFAREQGVELPDKTIIYSI